MIWQEKESITLNFIRKIFQQIIQDFSIERHKSYFSDSAE